MLFLLRVLVGIDDVAGLVLGRPQDHLVGSIAELREIVAGHTLELGEELPRLGPFAVLAEGDLAGDGGEAVTVGCSPRAWRDRGSSWPRPTAPAPARRHRRRA